MKLFKKIILFAAACLLIFGACSDDFLSPDPKSFFSPEVVYVDEAGFQALITTMKTDLWNDFYGYGHPIAMSHAISDLAVSMASADLRAHLTPNDQAAPWPTLDFFDDAYEYIRNANVLISRIDDADIEPEIRDRFVAKAYFFRSYWFYRIVSTYGDVPWVGQEAQGAVLDYQTYSRSAILDKLEQDLSWAEERLESGRMTDGTITQAPVTHLLAKVHLANLNFEEAEAAATRLIEDPGFALMTQRFGTTASDPVRNLQWDLHRSENNNLAGNTESLYTIIGRNDAPPSARAPSLYTNRQYSPSYWKILDSAGNRWCNWDTAVGDTLGIGNADVRTNHFWHYYIWEDDQYKWDSTPDERRGAEVNWVEMEEIRGCHEGTPNFGEYFSMDYYGSLIDTFDTWHPWPQYKIFVESPHSRLPVGDQGDWYLFRLAETYLIRAEARYWQNNMGGAADDINIIRERANAPLITAGDIDIDYIIDERARELYMEEARHNELARVAYIKAAPNRSGYSLDNFHEHNWFHDRIMRVNDNYHQPAPIWRGEAAHIEPRHVRLPIPQRTIEANTQGRINQNEGYDGAHRNEPPAETIE